MGQAASVRLGLGTIVTSLYSVLAGDGSCTGRDRESVDHREIA